MTTHWKCKINVAHLFDDYHEDKIGVKELANGLAEALQSTKYANEPRLIDLIDELGEIDDVDTFDVVMEEIYEWADEGNRIWINTYSHVNTIKQDFEHVVSAAKMN